MSQAILFGLGVISLTFESFIVLVISKQSPWSSGSYFFAET